jgi:hypothetical protein
MRRYADMLGVTVEFSKMEGLTFDPDRNKMYVSMSSIRAGMEDKGNKGKPSGQYDQPESVGGNAIRLQYNDCGCGALSSKQLLVLLVSFPSRSTAWEFLTLAQWRSWCYSTKLEGKNL